MRSLAVLAVLVALGSVASAQAPGMVTPSTPSWREPAPMTTKKKNPSTAVALSVLGTVGSFALAAPLAKAGGPGATVAGIGLFVGPSIGSWYAGKIGGIGIAGRSLGALMMLVGIVELISGEDCDYECSSNEDQGGLLLLGGGALWVGSTLYDWYAAGEAAHEWNREHGVTWGPTVIGGAGASRAPGFAVGMQF